MHSAREGAVRGEVHTLHEEDTEEENVKDQRSEHASEDVSLVMVSSPASDSQRAQKGFTCCETKAAAAVASSVMGEIGRSSARLARVARTWCIIVCVYEWG